MVSHQFRVTRRTALALGVTGLTADAGTVTGRPRRSRRSRRSRRDPDSGSTDVGNLPSPPTVGLEETYSVSPGYDAGWSVVSIPGDGFALAGYATQASTPNGFAAFLLKVDADGSSEWVREYDVLGDFADVEWSEAGAEFFVSLARIDDGFALAGPQFNSTDQRAWLVKTAADGTPEWTRTYGDSDGYRLAYAMTPATGGGYVLAGDWHAPDFSPSGVWFLRTDADGNPVVERTYEECMGVTGTAFDVTPFCDGYALTGHFFGGTSSGAGALRVDADGNVLWSNVLTSDAIAFAAADSAGRLSVASSAVFGADPSTITLSHLDANGTVNASHSLGTGIAHDVLVDAADVVLVGDAEDPATQGFAAAVAADGTERWRLPFDPVVRGLAPTTAGYAIVGDGPLLARVDV